MAYHLIECKQHFLNRLLEKEVFMQQPPIFLNSDISLVWKLNKAIYGLKQAPKAWFESVTTAHL